MRCLGLLGGMSWESTTHYYQLINQGVKERLGGLHSANLLMRSVDFAPIAQWQKDDEWWLSGRYLGDCALGLKQGGAEALIIATNTMHKVAEQIVEISQLPLIHIADCTGEELLKLGAKRVGLMATSFTMEQAFYKDRLRDKFQLDVIVPEPPQRKVIHDIIFNELCLGQVKEQSRQQYIQAAEALQQKGADIVIMGCTEISMLLDEQITDVPLVDTTAVHAKYAVDWLTEGTGSRKGK